MNAELKINETLPVLAFNFEQLKAWAAGLTERYADLLVSEDAIADVKRDMAEINKAKKAVDDARKEAVRRVSEPIRTFEGQIKEVCAIFDTAYAKLGNQVKAFEDAQREGRHQKVMAIIQGKLTHEGLDIQIPIRDKWLNKSTSTATIKAEIEEIFAHHYEEEHRKRALEQARQDRATAIEAKVKALNEQYGLNLPVSRFIINMGTFSSASLADVLADVEKSYAAALEQHRKQQEAMRSARPASRSVEQKTVLAEQPAPEIEQAAPEQDEIRVMSVVLQFKTSKEAQVKACLENLKTLCVNFGARYR